MVYQTFNWIDSAKELVSLTLPNVTAGSNSRPGRAAIKIRLHIFSQSMLPTIGSATDLEIQFARTQLWLPGTNKTQIVEVIINNVGSECVLANNGVTVKISSPGLNTVSPGYINRLQPGDQAKVEIGVVNADGLEASQDP
jgi:alpha-L-fucosidase